jgi:uncharacterized membrane protein
MGRRIRQSMHGECKKRMNVRTDQPVEDRHVAQRHLDRMVMLSDGIFAIAITLSAIELKPEAVPGKTLWQIWATPLFIYFISFFIIGQLWLMHRRIVAHLRDVDGIGAAINLLLLSLVALMPVIIRFALSGENGSQATQVYGTGLAVTYACMSALWAYLAFVAKLAPDVRKGLALSWLYESLFVAFAFIAIVFYAGHQMIGLAIASAIALLCRWFGARAARKEAPSA